MLEAHLTTKAFDLNFAYVDFSLLFARSILPVGAIAPLLFGAFASSDSMMLLSVCADSGAMLWLLVSGSRSNIHDVKGSFYSGRARKLGPTSSWT